MNIQIKELHLLNFKGVRNLTVSFGDITDITGDNGTGKTSINDAFNWLLFGKNSEDAKDFNIKTLDENSNPIHKLSHEVTGTFRIDGREIKLKRVYREKWTKKRGEETAEFTGHETEFFVDDVPMSQNEYKARVDLIIREDLAKLITNPLYFNQIKWQDRRTVLESMAGAISNADIAGNNEGFKKLLAQLGTETLVNFKKKISAAKKKIKDQLDGIPFRINEVQRSMPEPKNYSAIAVEIKNHQANVEAIELEIEDSSKAYQLQLDAIRAKQQEKFAMETKLQQLKQAGSATKQNKINTLNSTISLLTSDIKTIQSDIDRNNKLIASDTERIINLEDRNTHLREEWKNENAKTFTIDEHALNCPACKQALPEGERDEIRNNLTLNFNNSKASKLKLNQQEGISNRNEIERLKADSQSIIAINDELQSKLAALNNSLADTKEDLEMVKGWAEAELPEAIELREQINNFIIPDYTVVNNADLKAKKAACMQAIDQLKEELSTKDQIERTECRIKELEDEQAKLSQELADLERTEFTIDAFSKSKIETIEARINGKFKMVAFKMFEQQINGGEVECCECMVNGVPYSDVNTAGKINAGIDIINALTEHYQINAPVWIDNRESIIRILPCKSQIINLIAMKDAELSVASNFYA